MTPKDDVGDDSRGQADAPQQPLPEQEPLRPGLVVTLALAVVLGGLAGFLISGAAYLFLVPDLDDGMGALRGALVPLGTLAGLVAAALLLWRWRRRRR